MSLLLSQLHFHEGHGDQHPHKPEHIWQAPTDAEPDVHWKTHDEDGGNDGNTDQANTPKPSQYEQHPSEYWADFVSLHHIAAVYDSSLALNASSIFNDCE
jgi:hypothetical protein